MLKWLKNLLVESEESKERRRREEARREEARREEARREEARREEARREEEAHKAKVYRLADENAHLLRELVQLVGSDGGFGNRTRIREIGEELNRIGGMDLMRCIYYGVRNSGRYFSEDIWHGIGCWRC